MKIFKVKAICLYMLEEWEDIIKAESKEELLNMLSNNNQVFSIEEVIEELEDEDFNVEKFNLKNNIELLKKIKQLIDKLGTLESHLDDSSYWYKEIPLRDILFNLTLHYTTYKNNIDFEFPLYGTDLKEIEEKIKKVI